MLGKNYAELDVSTETEFRGNGYAKIASITLISELLEKDIIPNWCTWPYRIESQLLAKTIGFDPKHDVRAYIWVEEECGELTEINNICFADVPDEDCELDFVDVSLGKFLMYHNDKAIGSVGIHKRKAEYDREEYILGGFGALAILPQYRGNGYGKVLAEKAIEKLYEINCDVACLCVDRKHNAYKLYQVLGYTFLQRDAYFIDALGKEKTNDSVMILEIKNNELADKILYTNYKFHYGKGKGKGYW
ncbi:GNAT family N-acetyltransferase [Clostridium tagluense]|nr:GNAT family N-acetyltransferase [Clostridium tagluense]WLC63642.1 GNAT family N-acetyltransferase [Clostridium tagluense]